jgi:hypothetical protein
MLRQGMIQSIHQTNKKKLKTEKKNNEQNNIA